VLVEMIMTDESWYVVRNTPGVTGFVGSGSKPVPLGEAEVEQILSQARGEVPRVKIDLEPGEKVRVTAGPFQNFIGVLEEINLEKAKLKVMISMFGRETPIELDYSQVEKII
jgi:transcriptional antiterminator NusG